MPQKTKSARSILVIAIMVFCLNLQAQNSKDFTVKAGSSITDVLTFNEIYRYPEFIKGKVLYRDSTFIEARLNYNVVLGEMQFISNRGDTLVIVNGSDINYIAMLKDTFYVSNGYYEYITGNSNMLLLMKRYTKLKDIVNKGAYGTSNSSGAVDSYSSVSVGGNTSTYKLKADQDMIFSIKTEYYFRNKNSDFLSAREKNVMKLMPEYKDVIKKYIHDQSINFNNKEDLIKLTTFLYSLFRAAT